MESHKPAGFPRTAVGSVHTDPDLQILRWLQAQVEVPDEGYIMLTVPQYVKQLLYGCSYTERVMADALSGQQRSLFYRRTPRELQTTLVRIGGALTIAVHADGRYNCCHCLECWRSPVYKNAQYDTGRY